MCKESDALTLLLSTDGDFFGPPNVPILQIKVWVEIFFWSDGCGVVCSGELSGEVLQRREKLVVEAQEQLSPLFRRMAEEKLDVLDHVAKLVRVRLNCGFVDSNCFGD